MRTNKAGIDLIKSFEGLRLKAYRCAAGVVTIGFGTTRGIKLGDTCTEAEAETMLKLDLLRFEKAVTSLVKVSLNENQFSALVSFTYNLGEGALGESTLLKKLNVGDFDGARDEFAKWNRADGRVLTGLVRRRAAEAALFEKPVSAAPKGFIAKLFGK